MFISYSKSRHVDKSSSVMFTGRDGRTADAEHQQQQRRHIHIVHGPPRDRYAWFAMPAMLGASTAEVRWLLISISSRDSGGPGDGTFAYLALPHLLLPGFLHLTWVGIGLGQLFFAYSIRWKCQEQPWLFTTKLLPIGSFTPQTQKRIQIKNAGRSRRSGAEVSIRGGAKIWRRSNYGIRNYINFWMVWSWKSVLFPTTDQ